MKNKLTILVVEDEFLVAADIEESLILLGYEVQKTVATGKDAINEVARNLPDLILMDIILKGEMNGIEAATIIQQKYDVPIVYLTANADFATVEKAKTSLPYGYIIKPFTDKDLQTNIEIARFKFENDLKYKMESDQFHRYFNVGSEEKHEMIVESETGFEKVSVSDIYYIETVDEYTRFYFAGEDLKAKVSAEYIESKLTKDKFIRVSDKYIVNISKIFIMKLPEIIIADIMAVITVDDAYQEALVSAVTGE